VRSEAERVTKPDYDYYGLLASTWDVWRDNTKDWSDSLLYLDLVRQYGQPVLDVGCGTGRILLDYLAKGIDIEGVDNSPELLAICQTKAQAMGLSPTLYQQHMEKLDLPRRYRTILAPSSVLQLVADADVARSTVGRWLAHLEPGGALVAPFSFGWREGDPMDTGWYLLFEKPRPADGAVVRSLTRAWHEPEEQLWHTEQRFEVEVDGNVVQSEHQLRSPEGRWYTQQQARQLFHDAGFVDNQLFHDFTHESAREDDRLFCVLGVKP
jgi:ubiquinone/menaquinone biosynthesis C-methylase UbiE